MPYHNEHAARLRDPDEFAWIKEIWAKDSDGIRALGGQLKSDSQGATVEQTLRFKADKWTPDTAKKWCDEHKKAVIKFEDAMPDAEPEAKSAPVDYERRAFEWSECRAVKQDDGQMVIEGYAAVFKRKSVDMGDFIEELHPECFVPALKDSPDVVCLRNHDPNLLLGRTPNTLTLGVDKRGLTMRCLLPNTELGRDTFAAIERGDLKGQSFGFSNARSE
jgi:HK97 family phage prohead protease